MSRNASLQSCVQFHFVLTLSRLLRGARRVDAFDELVQIMRDKGAKPKPTEIAARYIFQNRIQTSTESVTDYHLSLKELAADCDFKENLEERLRG